MKDKKSLFLASGEPYQPVRLHYVIKKQKVYNILTGSPFVHYEKDHKGFLLSSELLFPSEGKVDDRFRDLWPKGSVARIFFTDDKHMDVVTPSYIRAADALSFLVRFLGKSSCHITGADVFMWQYEDRQENIQQLHRVNPFLDKTVITTDLSVYDAKLQKLIKTYKKAPAELGDKLNDLLAEAFSQPQPEVEYWKVEHTERGLLLFDSELELQLLVALERFKGNKTFNKFDAIALFKEAQEGAEGGQGRKAA